MAAGGFEIVEDVPTLTPPPAPLPVSTPAPAPKPAPPLDPIADLKRQIDEAKASKVHLEKFEYRGLRSGYNQESLKG